MTKTIQFHSWTLLNEPEADLTINKESEAEDNLSLLLSICDNLNELYETLNRLNCIIQTGMNYGNGYGKKRKTYAV
jgi:hypothetical protein